MGVFQQRIHAGRAEIRLGTDPSAAKRACCPVEAENLTSALACGGLLLVGLCKKDALLDMDVQNTTEAGTKGNYVTKGGPFVCRDPHPEITPRYDELRSLRDASPMQKRNKTNE